MRKWALGLFLAFCGLWTVTAQIAVSGNLKTLTGATNAFAVVSFKSPDAPFLQGPSFIDALAVSTTADANGNFTINLLPGVGYRMSVDGQAGMYFRIPANQTAPITLGPSAPAATVVYLSTWPTNWPGVVSLDGAGNVTLTFQPSANGQIPFAGIATNSALSSDSRLWYDSTNFVLRLPGLILASNAPPTTASSTGTPGQVAWDGGFFYWCIATNSWKRTAGSTW